jgi:hypothetical protein
MSVLPPGRERHCHDFAKLGAILAASDLSAFALERKDRRRLRTMLRATLATPAALDANPMAERRLHRLVGVLDT